MNEGQAAMMDALFFLLLCSVSATLLFYVSSLYGQGIDQQISTLYNYEFTSNALLSLMNTNDNEFWNGLRDKLDQEQVSFSKVRDNISDSGVWEDVMNATPSQSTFLCFKGPRCGHGPELKCYPHNYTYGGSSSQCPGLDGCGEEYKEDMGEMVCVCNERGFRETGYSSYTSSVSLFEGCDAIMKVFY